MKNWFFKQSLIVKIIIILFVFGGGYFIVTKINGGKSQKTQYQTATVEKGTLIVSVSASGQVSAANSASVSTQTSGVITNIYVTNGQQVKTSDPIAQVELDMDGKQRSSQAFSNYQSAQNALASAKAGLYTAQSDLFTKWDTFRTLAVNSTYQNADGSPNTSNRTLVPFNTSNDDWLASEAKYKNQLNIINQTQTAVNSAYASYLQASPVIYAPISGTITGLSLQVGSVITAQSNSSGGSTSQKIASIKTDASPIISVNLTEIDVPKVKIGNNVTVTIDALPGKTFTGKVISIDTIGITSSGVTTYPAAVKLDTNVSEIFSNMSATANIITATKDNVLLIPSSAVQSQNGESTVRILKNGQPQQVTVETGLSSDTQTEIVSGLSLDDTIVTSTTQNGSNGATNQTQSIFSGFGRGGNAARFGR